MIQQARNLPGNRSGAGPRPAIFFDRDGVLIENRDGYVREWEDVYFFQTAIDACRRLANTEFATVVVTNQAIVGRGLLTLKHVQELNERILQRFAEEGAPFEGVYVCPHHPDDGCNCRKPLPGMLLDAAKDHNLDLSHSYLIGDALTDMEAAEAAGAKGIMVRTGRGLAQEQLMTREERARWPVVGDVGQAVESILGGTNASP